LTSSKSAPFDSTNPDLAPVEQQAAAFEAVREARRSETAEDYVELIDDLIKATGEARVVDVAARMGVSHATVNRILARLVKEGLVNTQPYRSIFLTDAGSGLAQESRERHRIVVEFLCALGIDETTAQRDAEGIEHYVSTETIEAFQNWTGKLSE
jgi:DtxR family transcriptional regulator, manganese transport regulator